MKVGLLDLLKYDKIVNVKKIVNAATPFVLNQVMKEY